NRRELHSKIYSIVGQKYGGFSSEAIDKFNETLEEAVFEQLVEPKEKDEGWTDTDILCPRCGKWKTPMNLKKLQEYYITTGLPGTTTYLCPRCGYRETETKEYNENKEKKVGTIKEEKIKPILDLKKYGIAKWGKIGQFEIWIVDGPKIKAELDTNWCGPEESGCYIAGHPKVSLFTFLVPENTIIVSDERKGKEFFESLIHEMIEEAFMKRGYEYSRADPIAKAVENLFRKNYAN
ncbi:MAG: hypothetical protein AABY22_36870, partial [Nanoarchaeota archaeon]